MRRHKRNPNDRAFQRGYQAGVDGRSKAICPHEQGSIRQQWINGWREGRCDLWDGMTGVSGLHRLKVS